MKSKKEFSKSTNPHWYARVSSKSIARQFLISLAPIWVCNFFQNGLKAIALFISSVLLGLLFQLLFSVLSKKRNWLDEDTVFLSVLFASLVPFGISISTFAFGIFFVVIVAKECFGGSGQNVFNPAVVGFMAVSSLFSSELQTCYGSFGSVLINVKSPAWVSILELSLIVLSGMFLILRKVITWQVPVFYFFSILILTFIFQNSTAGQLLSAPIVFGAFFLITNYASLPVTLRGRIIFATGCGILFVALSEWFPGFSAIACAILLMNSAAPLIDRYLTSPHPIPLPEGEGRERGLKA